MRQQPSQNYVYIEEWIIILTNTYSEYPSTGLAKVINYYLKRLLQHDDFPLSSYYRCDYLTMMKYWQWVAKH
jgi:hypothetical protein